MKTYKEKQQLKERKAKRKARKKEQRSETLAEVLSILQRLKPCDFAMFLLVVILVIFGVVMVFSASYYKSISDYGTPYNFLIKQAFFAISGFVFMYLFSVMDYHLYRDKIAWVIMGVSILLLIVVLTPLGQTTNGATRWLKMGPITLMPGEIAKLAVILFIADFFAEDSTKIHSMKRGIAPLGVLLAVTCILVMLQPNLSTCLTLACIIAGMAVLIGLSWKVVAVLGALGCGGLVVLSQGSSYWADRLTSWIDPFQDAQGDGFQAVQSLLALGSGGLTGTGLGKSVQKNLYLPEPQTDYILAIIGEELGFIGVLILMIVFLLLIWRCFMIAVNAPDQRGMMLAGGLGITLGLQVVFNVAIVTSSMPSTGVALPFVSYGGNAIWIFMILAGIVLNVSRQSKTLQKPVKKKKKSRVQIIREREQMRKERGTLV